MRCSCGNAARRMIEVDGEQRGVCKHCQRFWGKLVYPSDFPSRVKVVIGDRDEPEARRGTFKQYIVRKGGGR